MSGKRSMTSSFFLPHIEVDLQQINEETEEKEEQESRQKQQQRFVLNSSDQSLDETNVDFFNMVRGMRTP